MTALYMISLEFESLSHNFCLTTKLAYFLWSYYSVGECPVAHRDNSGGYQTVWRVLSR